MNLHLGCGTKWHPDYINIDRQQRPNVDSVEDIRFLLKYPVGSVKKIYACHVLEHFGRWEFATVLRRWYELLYGGGRLRIAVPDFSACVQIFSEDGNVNKILGLLYGGQDYDVNFHKMIWTFESMKRDLESVGFRNVGRYDWENDD